MEALVMMLKNTTTQRWHPIFYFENNFAGGHNSDLNMAVIRYKSKGHHTVGFDTREMAVNSVNNELINQIKSVGYNPIIEIEEDLEWDGISIPADIQIRSRKQN